ncbi:hypothetical protein DES40_2458 [Litorimonas taeanensis]|uniref:DUF4440 domain-containing protein n=1 Tax=Litorimonas taeanensis TaxID=568099 RepID=A0A420WF85_9PROT|nr:hypothetical protein [Litorimonas taeanensis]RKQ69654.1 hypothetical protein DES40_2458 [Litorimonas taeanensis]
MPLIKFPLKRSGALCAAIILSCSGYEAAFAQNSVQSPARAQGQSPAQIRPALPDENTLARLVWSTMIALDNANRTNNYTVLNQLGSPQFQQVNTPSQLSELFSELRRNRIDIGRSILSTPNYYRPPEILSDGTLRLRGGFDFRPKSIRFDIIYSNIGGGWRINALSVVEMDAAAPKR